MAVVTTAAWNPRQLGDGRNIDRRYMDALEARFGLTVLDLHPIEHFSDIRLEDGRWLGRRRHARLGALATSSPQTREEHIPEQTLEMHRLKSLSCSLSDSPRPSVNSSSTISSTSSVRPKCGTPVVRPPPAPYPVDGRRCRPIVPPILGRNVPPVLLLRSCRIVRP